jgi:hypothetical protein
VTINGPVLAHRPIAIERQLGATRVIWISTPCPPAAYFASMSASAPTPRRAPRNLKSVHCSPAFLRRPLCGCA